MMAKHETRRFGIWSTKQLRVVLYVDGRSAPQGKIVAEVRDPLQSDNRARSKLVVAVLLLRYVLYYFVEN